MKPSPRHPFEQVHLPVHGALDYVELEHLGLRPEGVLDFSSNINPYGPCPAVQGAMEATRFSLYPDREALALRQALSLHLRVPAEQILAGNGSAELLLLVALAYLRPADLVLVLGPTFGEYAHISRLMEAEVRQYVALPEDGFTLQPAAVTELLEKDFYRLVFLCNPNNPTGQIVPLVDLQNWVVSRPETLFVVDEAYLPFAPQGETALQLDAENVVVLRSMTKDYALAGLRLGYALAPPDVIWTLRLARPPWNVNALAQVAGIVALQDEIYLRSTIGAVLKNKTHFVAGLQAAGWQPLPSHTHFFLVPVRHAGSFRSRLLRRSIKVRDCASFGLPDYVRLSTRLPEENARLLAALEEEFA